jgi:divalent metal cation (Fe/Co/Zn/Cd) transporter
VDSSRARAAVTLGVALGVNVTVTVLKAVAAGVTGSAATAAECVHSAVDTTNQVLMGIGLWRAHSTGKAHLEYVWGVAAAGAMFVTGCVYGIYDGLRTLITPEVHSSAVWALTVLGLSFVLESVSFTRAATELWRGKGDRGFWVSLKTTTDLTTKATFCEDASDLAGNLLAAVGVTAMELTGSSLWDGYAAIAVGVVVGWVATQMGRHNRRLWKETVTA